MLDLLLTGGAEWFTGVAFLSTLLFSVTVLLMFLGGDGGLDADIDLDLDVPDGSGADNSAFKILSFQGVIGFGMGWGLAGLCPGPSIASLSYGGIGGTVFLLAMFAGMWFAPILRDQLDNALPAT
ncbi:hypothetical protein EBU58_07700 [bacterium]|nr:hypothetical protein [bacterium]